MTAILVALAVAGGVNDTLNPRQFQIDLTVYKGDPLGSKAEGKVKCLMEPRLTILNGRSAHIQVGSAQSGCAIEFLPLRYANGAIWVEVSARVRETRSVAGRAEATEQSSRHTRMTVSGEKFRVRLAADSPENQTWAEVTVTELPRGK